MITTIHHNLPKSISKNILKSVIGSLNATAIAYARGHLRFNAAENGTKAAESRGYKRPAHADEMHIDDINDALAAVSEQHEKANASEGFGFDKQMPSDELAERLMIMRNYLAAKLDDMAELPNDKPLTIKETVKFQMERTQDANLSLLEAMAIAVDIDFDILKEAKLKMIEDDRADLIKNAGKIITFLEAFDGQYHEHDQVEYVFDQSPAHVQYKLIMSAVRAHDKASDRAMTSLLRGKLEAAGDMKMIKASKADIIVWLRTFTITHNAALSAYVERGGSLPPLEDNTIITAATERAATQVKARAVVAPVISPKLTPLTAIVDGDAPTPADQVNAVQLAKAKAEPKAKGTGTRVRGKKSPVDATV